MEEVLNHLDSGSPFQFLCHPEKKRINNTRIENLGAKSVSKIPIRVVIKKSPDVRKAEIPGNSDKKVALGGGNVKKPGIREKKPEIMKKRLPANNPPIKEAKKKFPDLDPVHMKCRSVDPKPLRKPAKPEPKAPIRVNKRLVKTVCEVDDQDIFYGEPSLCDVKKMFANLQNEDWDVRCKGLKDLAKFTFAICWSDHESQIALVIRKLIDYVGSPRSMLSRAACLAAGKFLVSVKCSKRPEFDELMITLLNRTADTNNFIRKYSGQALDEVVKEINPGDCLRVLCSSISSHKSNAVRIVCARLLETICSKPEIRSLIGPETPKKSKSIHKTLANYLEDKTGDVRKSAENCVMLLKKYPAFSKQLLSCVSNGSKNRIKFLVDTI